MMHQQVEPIKVLTQTSQRDLRVDFFRGMALLLILWGHGLHASGDPVPAFRVTTYYWFFSDAFEMFIFLSGFAFGLAYEKVLRLKGFAACQLKALNRCWQLYVANGFTFLLVIGLMSLVPRIDQHVFVVFNQVYDDPGQLIPQFLGLMYLPWLFQVLPLYIVMLLMMPAVLWLMRHHALFALGVSGGLWLCTQFVPAFNMPSFEGDGATWFFNPFAWQFLFVIGMLLSIRIHREGWQLPRIRWLLALAVLMAISPLVLRVLAFLSARDIAGLHAYDQWFTVITFPYIEAKSTLGPLRIVHFLALVYIVACTLPRTLSFWQSAAARPLILCGQHSLEIFCVGVVLAYSIGIINATAGGNAALLLGLNISACVLSCIAAWVLHVRQSPPWQMKSGQRT